MKTLVTALLCHGRLGARMKKTQKIRQTRKKPTENNPKTLCCLVLRCLHTRTKATSGIRYAKLTESPCTSTSNLGIGSVNLAQRLVNERQHLGNQQDFYLLALADAPHSVRALRVVPKGHVLAQREAGNTREGLLDVHTHRVNMVIESETLVPSQAALCKLNDLTLTRYSFYQPQIASQW